MYHGAAELRDSVQRLRDIAHGKVGQREGIAGPAATRVDADCRGARVRLPTFPLSLLARLQLSAEEPGPEASRALGVVGGKFDEGQRRRSHHRHDTTPQPQVWERCRSRIRATAADDEWRLLDRRAGDEGWAVGP